MTEKQAITRRIVVTLTRDTHRALRDAAEARGELESVFVRGALARRLGLPEREVKRRQGRPPKDVAAGRGEGG